MSPDVHVDRLIGKLVKAVEVSLKATEAARGACDLNQIHLPHRLANAGYWIRTSATGRGVASAAIRQLARFALALTDLVRFEIVCAVGKSRSQRVAEKAGATREAVLRDRLCLHGRQHDAVMYAILRSGWSVV